VLGFEDFNASAHNVMSSTLSTGERHVAGNANNQTQESSPKLVMMESAGTDASVPTVMEQANRLWLSDFLVNGAQNSYNTFDPNGGIKIKILDDEDNLNPFLRRLYGKRTRS
jgi:hypothetical protein